MEPNGIVQTILGKLGNENLIGELTASLSQSEISTLLLALSKEMTEQRTPGELLVKYASNRFVAPSPLSPVRLKKIELAMLELAESRGFDPVELSPAGLLGSCSVMAKVDQNKVVSAARGVELLSDSTNMLALAVAHGIKSGTMDNRGRDVHVCSACRVTRAQLYAGSQAVPHFGLFAMVSSGKDTGSYRFEKDALAAHVGFYAEYFGKRPDNGIEVRLSSRQGYADPDGFMDRVFEHLRRQFPAVKITLDREESGNLYYAGLNFQIAVNGLSVVDGGFTDWTRQLLGSKKERLLISGAGVDVQLTAGLK